MTLQAFIAKSPTTPITAAWLNKLDVTAQKRWHEQCTVSGTVNAVILTTPATGNDFILSAGSKLCFIPAGPNTGAVTVNVNAGGDVALVNEQGSACTGGELSTPVEIVYTGTVWQLVNPAITIDKAKTAAETAASVTPTSLFYFPRPQLYLDRYGADSTGATFSDTAMANALLVAAQKGGATIILDGNYKFANSYILGESVILQGNSMLGNKLLYTGSGTFITFPSAGGRQSIRDLWLSGTGKTGIGLQLGDTNFAGYCTANKVRIQNFATGIRFAGTLYTTIEDSLIDGNGVGGDFNAGWGAGFSTTVQLLRNNWRGNDNEGLKASNVPIRNQNISIVGGAIEGNCTASPGTTSQHVVGSVGELKIDNVYYEYATAGTKPNAIDLTGAGNFEVMCFINGARDGIVSTASSNGNIRGSRFVGTTSHDLNMTGGVNVNNIIADSSNTFSGIGNVMSGVNVWVDSGECQNKTFTPTIRGSGTAGTPTYTVQSGSYSKKRNVVTFDVRVSITAKTGMAGNISIEGLPEARATFGGLGSIFSMDASGVTVSGANTYLYAQLSSGSTSLLLMQGGSTSNAQLVDTNIAAATTIQISGSYQTSS